MLYLICHLKIPNYLLGMQNFSGTLKNEIPKKSLDTAP